MALFRFSSKSVTGLWDTIIGTDTPDATPANDAGRVLVLPASGVLDSGFTGAPGATISATNGGVAVAAGDPMYYSGGVTLAADATDDTKECVVIAAEAAIPGAVYQVIPPGNPVTFASGLTSDKAQFLQIGGGITEDVSVITVPGSGNGLQKLGTTIDANSWMFWPESVIKM